MGKRRKILIGSGIAGVTVVAIAVGVRQSSPEIRKTLQVVKPTSVEGEFYVVSEDCLERFLDAAARRDDLLWSRRHIEGMLLRSAQPDLRPESEEWQLVKPESIRIQWRSWMGLPAEG